MYQIERTTEDSLFELTKQNLCNTVFLSLPWVEFLKNNQNGEPVILKISDSDNIVVGYFVGLIVKKAGIRILGSPFDGWLTCDMGFIRFFEDFNVNEALSAVKNYAFKNLKCLFVQITDKNIKISELSKSFKIKPIKMLYIDNGKPLDDILNNFTKNGRRDVRASSRKGIIIKQVPFDNEFVKIYYDQLVDVFAKQNLKPNYGLKKLNDMVEAFKDFPDNVLALEAVLPDEDGKETVIATVLSFAGGTWAYYLGAASYRSYQKYLPNEALMWEMIKHWNSLGIKNLDLVGYREYKLKYNPQFVEYPIIYFEKIPGLLFMKNKARKCVELIRKLKK